MAKNQEFYNNVSKYEALVVGGNKAVLNSLRSAIKSLGFKKADPGRVAGACQARGNTHLV
jgi:hypothetical protein